MKSTQTPTQKAAVAYVQSLFSQANPSLEGYGELNEQAARQIFTMIADAFVAGRESQPMRNGTIMVKDSIGTSYFHANGEINHV